MSNGHHEHVTRAVNAPVVPHTMTMVVTPAGVTRLADFPGSSDFGTVGVPFVRWMEEQHPEDATAVECCGWDSVEQARQHGLLTARYAEGTSTPPTLTPTAASTSTAAERQETQRCAHGSLIVPPRDGDGARA